MSIELMTKAFKAKVNNPLRKLVLIKLADNANDKGVCHPSYQHIADQCEISRRSVIDHVKALQEMGVLTIKHRMNEGENTSNSFHICEKKLTELGSAGAALGSESTAPLKSKKRAPDSLGSERDALGSAGAAPPLVQELHPEPSLSNHHLTVNESILDSCAPAIVIEKQTSIKKIPSNCDEAKSYAAEIGLNESEGERFYDYYSANGWMVGKSAMKDWKAAMRNWKRNAEKYRAPQSQQHGNTYDQQGSIVQAANSPSARSNHPQSKAGQAIAALQAMKSTNRGMK